MIKPATTAIEIHCFRFTVFLGLCLKPVSWRGAKTIGNTDSRQERLVKAAKRYSVDVQPALEYTEADGFENDFRGAMLPPHDAFSRFGSARD